MTDVFTLDPDYVEFPEKGQLKLLTVYGEQNTFITQAVLLFIFYSFVTVIFLASLPREIAFLTNGNKSVATVTDTCKNGGGRSYHYTYSVKDIDGTLHHYENSTAIGRSETCPELNATIEILYLYNSPNDSRTIGPGSSSLFSISLYILLLGFCIFAVKMSFTAIKAFYRAKVKYPRLKAATRIIDGSLTSIRNDNSSSQIMGRWRGSYYVVVDYAFYADGVRYTGTQTKIRNDLRNKPLPERGAFVRVLVADASAYVIL